MMSGLSNESESSADLNRLNPQDEINLTAKEIVSGDPADLANDVGKVIETETLDRRR